MKKIKISKLHLYLTIITLIAFGIRIACCFWGYPFRLHPDEPSVVANTIDMLMRQSWEANVYSRPDQFEIKCCAFLFQLVSRIIYHLPAVEAFAEHEITFYLIARVYTAFLGTAMIPVSAVLINYLFENEEISVKRVQIISALFIAFSPSLTLHSSYATPDIPLALITMLFAIFFIRYIKKGQMLDMIICAVLTGVAISTKWPGAILCIFIAMMIIFRAVKKEISIKNVFQYGSLSIILVLATLFIMAPNLFTNIGKTISDVLYEARTEHLGADGLGTWGNFIFYLKVMLQNTGILAIIPCCIGIGWLIKKHHIEYLALLIGGMWWICMSILSLHWIRWCVPAYGFYFILVAVGIVILQTQMAKGKYIANIILLFVITNMCALELAQTKNVLCDDSRVVAYNYCNENGITPEESMSEGYTPFAKPYPYSIWREFEAEGNNLKLINDEYASCRYLVVGSHYWDLFAEEPERYENSLQIYNNFENNYQLIYHLKADNIYMGCSDNRMYSIWGTKNIVNSIQYLLRPVTATGYDIYIYDMRK